MAPAAFPSCMANEVFANSRISWAGSFIPSGIGIGTGPANMPATSPSPKASPSRSDITEATASFIDWATGAANSAHASSVPSTQPERVSSCTSPGTGSNRQTVSSHRFASLTALRASWPCSAFTVRSLPSPFACCNAMEVASLTLMGPSCTVRCISSMVFSPPAVNACIIDCTSAGLGNRLGSWLSSCSRIGSGRFAIWLQAISP